MTNSSSPAPRIRMVDEPSPQKPIDQLIGIMARLRDPVDGCGWDRAQSFATIAPYTVEEAYEVADAIERGDLQDLKEELGDLLFQVVFHARMAEEEGSFAFDDVVRSICEKMLRRHPHVFANARFDTREALADAWEDSKSHERNAKGRAGGLLSDIPAGLPGLTRAVKLSKRAARVGFVWSTAEEVLEKLDEELEELRAEVRANDLVKAREELGDLLFVCANLARHLDIDPEDALRTTNAKFVRRFEFIEAALAESGRTPAQSDLGEMDQLWNQAKARDKAAP